MLVPREHSHSSVKDAYCSSPYLFNDRVESLLWYNHTVVNKLVRFAISYKLHISCKDNWIVKLIMSNHFRIVSMKYSLT